MSNFISIRSSYLSAYIPDSIVEHAVDKLTDGVADSASDSGEVHHKLFNEDYFIIGYWAAEQWLKENNISAFTAIEAVKQWEIDNFGETHSDLSNAESVVNLLAYTLGQELLNRCDCCQDWEDYESSEIAAAELAKELQGMDYSLPSELDDAE